MDFYHISEEPGRNNMLKVYPDFKACRSKDLMIRGRSFYAIWDKEKGMWSTDEYDVQRLVDQELDEYKKDREKSYGGYIDLKRMINMSSNMWKNYRAFIREMSDNSKQLDNILTFANSEVKKTDYVSRRLSYPLEEGTMEAYDTIMSTLYEPDERAKLEWAIGAIVSGDAKNIQKFIVLYGEAGSGKSTFLNIVQKLFDGYYTTFEAKALTSVSNSFSTEVFRTNPLVAIQHDGDLSKIEDNTKLNSLISHEEMTMNEKYKPSYTARSNAFLFMGTNKPVKITDAKSGIIRRLIDVRPSGNKLPTKKYHALMGQIDFELGAIAYHCLNVYREMGKNYYSTYRPLEMMFQTDVFFNFVEANYHLFKEMDGITLAQAYDIYKNYCDESLVEFKLVRHKFREELKSYFKKFQDIARVDNKQVRSYYSGFLTDKFVGRVVEKEEEHPYSLVLDNTESILDKILAKCPAQYATDNEIPEKKWTEVTTKLEDLNTKLLHYVRPPDDHIVIDFDLKDDESKKSIQLNLEAASKWPPTYAEFSKSGAGIHLHYIYEGDVQQLSRIYSEGIEVKPFTGASSLRRKLSKCNNSPIAKINSGLPLKGAKMINFDSVQSEQGLRNLITRNLNKEIHPGTKPSMDFIYQILEDAYNSGLKYDITDMRPKILVFANNSTNQADYCIKLITKMKFASEETSNSPEDYSDDKLIFYDVEVFPNLFVVVWKPEGEGKKKIKMINPSPKEIEELLKFKLVGFNCRRYDNHIMYARYLGWNNEELFKLSQKIINNSRNGLFGEAYNLSYTDVYDFSSKKQSLKKFEIELGLHHQELGLPWDQPVSEELWSKVADYCGIDVDATEATFNARKQDYIARLILSDLSGLTPNDTTQMHTAKIIFGDDKRPQDKFVYTDLSKEFPGYKFENGKSTYRGEEPGEGGNVYAEPGMHVDAAVLDITSMHPRTLILLNLFGPYTKNFEEVVDARITIKHKEYDKAKKMLNGKLAKYLTNEEDAQDLSYSLKIVINIVYGLTSAKFDNKFKDPRNKDNIVAKRGALFMIDLKRAVQEKGFTVAHIKTDSIKIPNATPDIIQFVQDFGKQYGYNFEHESTYAKMCLVNDAVYIAKTKDLINPYYDMPDSKDDLEQIIKGEWVAVGAQFAQKYVFKTLFSKEPIAFEDLCETRAVSSALYLDMNENLPDVSIFEKQLDSWNKKWIDSAGLLPNAPIKERDMLEEEIKKGHDYHFIGKVGLFCPIQAGKGGGVLLREKDGKYYAASGTKGYRWLESEMVQNLHKEGDVDLGYFNALVDDAVSNISKYGDFEWFVSDAETYLKEEHPIGFNDLPPWYAPCGMDVECRKCSSFVGSPTDPHCKKGHSLEGINIG